MILFEDDEQDVLEPSKCMSDMLQAGETICAVCIDPVKHIDPVSTLCLTWIGNWETEWKDFLL